MIHLQVLLNVTMDEGECKETEAAFVRLIASLVAAPGLMSLDWSGGGDGCAGEYGVGGPAALCAATFAV
jgi:hypothetical protein